MSADSKFNSMQKAVWESAKARWKTDRLIRGWLGCIGRRQQEIVAEEREKWNVRQRKEFLEKCRLAGAPVMEQETKRWEKDEATPAEQWGEERDEPITPKQDGKVQP